MSYSYVKERNRRRESDLGDDRDPSCAADLTEAPPGPKPRKVLDPDCNWGLATYFSERATYRLDLAQKRRLAGYMNFLLEVRKLSPDRVRQMVEAYVGLTNNRYVASPVGYFTYLEDQLISRTEPAEAVKQKDYSGWGSPVRSRAKEYAWE